jgi:hypothetical protein
MSFSTFEGNTIIDHNLRGTAYTAPSAIYASLHTADPGLIGSNEVTGGSYARQVVGLSAAAAKSTSNSAILSYVYMPSTNVLYAGLWHAGFGGSFLMSGSLSASKIVNSGDTFQFQASNFVVTLT